MAMGVGGQLLAVWVREWDGVLGVDDGPGRQRQWWGRRTGPLTPGRPPCCDQLQERGGAPIAGWVGVQSSAGLLTAPLSLGLSRD